MKRSPCPSLSLTMMNLKSPNPQIDLGHEQVSETLPIFIELLRLIFGLHRLLMKCGGSCNISINGGGEKDPLPPFY